MKLKIYQVDAFTDRVFSGNPAAVCPLDSWLPDDVMQNIALENNLAETAFYVKNADGYEIRWFTPAVEVDLCGHATLAAAYVLHHHEGYNEDEILFFSPRSGLLKVSRTGDYLTLDFPSDVFGPVDITAELTGCFGQRPGEAFKGKTDYMLVFDSETAITGCKPDLPAIAKLPGRGVIITAPGDHSDFVSRFFAPQSGIDEDPVTGSAHTTLTPYWAARLQKDDLTAIQLSGRKGYLNCKYRGDRVDISGQARLYLTGDIYLP